MKGFLSIRVCPDRGCTTERVSYTNLGQPSFCTADETTFDFTPKENDTSGPDGPSRYLEMLAKGGGSCFAREKYAVWKFSVTNAHYPGGVGTASGEFKMTVGALGGVPQMSCLDGTWKGLTCEAKNYLTNPSVEIALSINRNAPMLSCPKPPVGIVGQRYYRITCNISGYPAPRNVTTSGNVPPPVRRVTSDESPHVELTADTLYLDWDDLDGNQLTTAGTYEFTITVSNGEFPDASVPVKVIVNKP